MIGVRFFCVYRVLFSMNTCGFLLFTEFWCFGMRFSGLAVVAKFGCHIDRTISFVAKHLLTITETTSE